MGDSKDLEVWAKSVGLAPDTLRNLQEDGFTNLSMVRLLTPEVINESFEKTKRLPLAQCLALQKALTQMRTSSFPASEAASTDLQQGDCFDLESMCSAVPYQGLSRLTVQPVSNPNDEVVRLLMVGKTGGGKSSTANTILGYDAFNCEMRFDSVTDECSLKSSTRDGLTIEIMDSPGLFDTRKSHEEVSVDIARAVTCLHPGPHAILYVVRIGRFTQEDEDVFTRLIELFDKNLQNYTIVIFTGGDELERRGKKIYEILDKAPDNLIRILKACNNRYVVFNNMATNKHHQVKLLLSYVHKISDENDGVPYTCPKYFYISEAVEQEVNERMAKAEQKILQEKRYVQELEARTRQAEEDLAREKEELQKKEQERKQEMIEVEKKRRVELESLKQQLEKQQINEEQRRQETEAFLRKLEEEKEQQKREIEEEKKNYKEKKRKMEEIRANMITERKKLKEEELRIHKTEMKKLKNSFAENQMKGWISFLADVVEKIALPVFLDSRSSGSDVVARTSLSRSHQNPLQHENDSELNDRAASVISGAASASNPFGTFLNPLSDYSRFRLKCLESYAQECFKKMNEKK